MKKLRIGRPSPAMIVAITALCVSVVGTAFAGPIAEISGLRKKDKRVVRRISRNISNRVSNRRITKRAPRLSVLRAQVANSATTARLLDGLDASAFLGKEQLFVSSAADRNLEEHVLIAFPDLGFELRTTNAAEVGFAATAAGNYLWSGYVNGEALFTTQGPSAFVVAIAALEDFGEDAGEFNRFAMVRRDPDGSHLGVATADCFRMPNTSDQIACLGHSASSG